MEMDRLRRAMVVRVMRKETIINGKSNNMMGPMVTQVLLQGSNRVAVH